MGKFSLPRHGPSTPIPSATGVRIYSSTGPWRSGDGGWGLVSQDHIHFIGTKALQRKTVAFEATIWEWFTPSMQFVSKITCAILGMDHITTY